MMKCAREMKYIIAMTKAAFNKEKAVFTSKLGLNLRKKLINCYILSIALHGAKAWTFRKVNQNSWKVLKCGADEG
jgi:accessory gene regulator protein AgrB